MSKEYTVDEVREEFLHAVRDIAICWTDETDHGCPEGEDPVTWRVWGALFSMLALLDGVQGMMPAFILAPNPYPEDKQYCIDNAKNYFPGNINSKVKCNISGILHDDFLQLREPSSIM